MINTPWPPLTSQVIVGIVRARVKAWESPMLPTSSARMATTYLLSRFTEQDYVDSSSKKWA